LEPPRGALPRLRVWRNLCPQGCTRRFLSRPIDRFPTDDILRQHAQMPVHDAENLTRFQTGHIYVCPADRHLYLENGILRVENSPRERFFRPSINYLFRSAASVYGRRVIGVVLSGSMDDGTAGLWQIKKRGGVTIAQYPADTPFPTMPQSAIDNVAVDFVLDMENLAKKLIELTGNRDDESQPSDDRVSVLIVEDENIVANNLSQALIQRGYVISGKVRSGEEAIEAVGKTNPRIVLMDIRLAGSLAGTEAAREIWDRFQVPVIYLTAYADRELVEEVKTTENYGYITKPFNSDQVHVAIELALDRREKELRVPPDDARSAN
jgi:chemotaxis response regulator CheB